MQCFSRPGRRRATAAPSAARESFARAAAQVEVLQEHGDNLKDAEQARIKKNAETLGGRYQTPDPLADQRYEEKWEDKVMEGKAILKNAKTISDTYTKLLDDVAGLEELLK